MRGILVLTAGIGLLAASIPAPAVAAAAIRDSNSQTGLLCELATSADFVSVGVQASGADAFAFMAVWAPDADPFGDLPTVVSADSVASLEGSTLRAAFDLVNASDERAAGSASLGVTLTAIGDPTVWSDEGSDGNRRFRVEQRTQLLAVDGTLVIDLFDGTHDEVALSTCGASTDSTTFFATNPSAWVYGGPQVFLSCEWTTNVGAVSLFAVSDETQTLSQVIVVGRDEAVLLGIGDHVLSATGYEIALGLVDLSSGEVIGDAIAEATLSASRERIADVVRSEPYRLNTIGRRLSVSGSLTLDLSGGATTAAMDDASCRAGDVRVQVREKIRP